MVDEMLQGLVRGLENLTANRFQNEKLITAQQKLVEKWIELRGQLAGEEMGMEGWVGCGSPVGNGSTETADQDGEQKEGENMMELSLVSSAPQQQIDAAVPATRQPPFRFFRLFQLFQLLFQPPLSYPLNLFVGVISI